MFFRQKFDDFKALLDSRYRLMPFEVYFGILVFIDESARIQASEKKQRLL